MGRVVSIVRTNVRSPVESKALASLENSRVGVGWGCWEAGVQTRKRTFRARPLTAPELCLTLTFLVPQDAESACWWRLR